MEIIKLKTDVNKIGDRKTIEKIDKIKSWFFKKMNKIEKPLAKLSKK